MHTRLILTFALIATLTATPAFAGATAWQDVAPGARLRLVTSDVRTAEGRTLVGLELDMPKANKTYWRLPGETGIPTQIDFTGSAGVASPMFRWPYPIPEVTQGFLDYVYRGPTVLPLWLTVSGDNPQLKAAVVMGVCSEVCVPVQAKFDLQLSFAAADMGQSLRLKQAEALAPIPWAGAVTPFGPASFDAAAKQLRLPLPDPSIDPASIIVSTTDPTVIFDAPQKSPDGQALLLALRGGDAPAGWLAKPVQLTFMTAMGSFEVSEQVTARQP
jgi:DsbC/DsbD-like thiol-disulfide interchange protein